MRSTPTRIKPQKIYLKKMVIESELINLTDARYWKPIYEEIKRIQEQREILKASICSMGVK